MERIKRRNPTPLTSVGLLDFFKCGEQCLSASALWNCKGTKKIWILQIKKNFLDN